jgi:hypothetical protein
MIAMKGKALLADQIPLDLAEKPDPLKLLDVDDKATVEQFIPEQSHPMSNVAGECRSNLYFGFFFDGTKNNYEKADADKSHSNVVRLYDCFPGRSVPGVLNIGTDWKEPQTPVYPHCYRTYIPGVSSPFSLVKDSGEGLDYTLGAASGRHGERRIAWALIQAVNNVHRFFFKDTPLVSSSETTRLACSLNLDHWYRDEMYSARRSGAPVEGGPSYQSTFLELQKLLKKLQAAVALHRSDQGRPAKCSPVIVKEIHVSIFGFSRGATQARAFTNWFMALCTLDAELCGKAGLTLGGFPVVVDFLGLFDTVASVGLANSFGDAWWGGFLDGHGDWADAEANLRVPDDVRCLHLVAAHEIRRSFPVDSVCHKGHMPTSAREVVVPGVHSDVGCGYCPTEQGRGTDSLGRDMLAHVPLLLMYKEALLAGVPLRFEEADAKARERFEISKDLIEAYNAYIEVCKVKSGTLTEIMREQTKLRIQYCRLRAGTKQQSRIVDTASYGRASNFDKNDLRSAFAELGEEIGAFEQWLASINPSELPDVQPDGFGNDKDNEWKQIAKWWQSADEVPPAVLRLFDDYVHDSRAWFKLSMEPDNERDLRKQLDQWVALLEGEERNVEGRWQSGLTVEQRKVAQEFRLTKQIPLFGNHGRENWKYAGYLRYRKVYAGADAFLISKINAKPGRKMFQLASTSRMKRFNASPSAPQEVSTS